MIDLCPQTLRWASSAILLAGIIACGCDRGQTNTPLPTSAEERQRFAELVGARRSPDATLRDELARLQSEQALPLQLAAAVRPVAPTVAETALATNASAATSPRAQWAEIFPPFTRPYVAEQIQSVRLGERVTLDAAEGTRARETLERHRLSRDLFTRHIRACSSLGLAVQEGPLADLEAIGLIALGCRLETLAAAIALADAEPLAAAQSWEVLLRSAELLDAEFGLAPRMRAAEIRRLAWPLLAAIHNHPQTTVEAQQRLRERFQTHWERWPADARVWHGERAAGLIAYELARSGYLLSLLSEDETQQLLKRNMLHVTARAAVAHIDADEVFYLQCARRMIDACEQPYYQRTAVLRQIRTEIDALRDTPQYPYLAATHLLTDFEAAQRSLAADRAYGLAVAVGLAQTNGARLESIRSADGTQSVPATGEDAIDTRSVPATINPLTGRAYQVEVRDGEAIVAEIDPAQPALVIRLMVIHPHERQAKIRSDRR